MVSELGVTDNPDKVGFYSGLVVCEASLQPFWDRSAEASGIGIRVCAVLHSVPLGEALRVSIELAASCQTYTASRIGRKPVIIIGLVGVAISGGLL